MLSHKSKNSGALSSISYIVISAALVKRFGFGHDIISVVFYDSLSFFGCEEK